ncbi:MAG: GNAT family N-acetyltransferase [Kineosporiaceae bacterium]
MDSRHPLRTERLVVVPQTLAAARALLAGEDPGLPLAEGYPHADTLDGLRMSVAYLTSDDELGWFITLAEDGRVIGDCGAKGRVDEAGRVEIGYGLAAPFRAQGYGSEAVGALVGWLRAQPDVQAVTAEVHVGNVASRRLLERLGFTLDGEADGSWWFVLPA